MCSQFIIVLLLVILISELVYCDPNEICSTFSGRRIYSDKNGRGTIQAANISTSNLKKVRLIVHLQLSLNAKILKIRVKFMRKSTYSFTYKDFIELQSIGLYLCIKYN